LKKLVVMLGFDVKAELIELAEELRERVKQLGG